MGRNRYQVPVKKNQSFTLNITSMTDMFTILLVFLLQSFAAGEVQIDAAEGVRLPSSTTEKNPVNGVKLSISPTELKFDQTLVAKVSNNLIDQSAIDSSDSNFIKPLFDQLEEVNKKNPKLAKMGKVLLQADESLPYSTIRKIMYTASMAGFPNVKLITTVGN
jgi:biopolymer transport protein ExbD